LHKQLAERKLFAYMTIMIKSFRSKSLAQLWATGTTAGIDKQKNGLTVLRLETLNLAERPDDMNVQGYDFHPLRRYNLIRYSVHVNGPWCLTFEFEGADAYRVDFEQYH
jgi:proteic killer suppression protein